MHERINARVDADSARRLTELTTGTGKLVIHVVCEAIAVYHAQLIKPRKARCFLALAGKYRSGHGDSHRFKSRNPFDNLMEPLE